METQKHDDESEQEKADCSQSTWNGWHLSTIFCIFNIVFYAALSATVCLTVKGDPNAVELGGQPFPFNRCWMVQMAFVTSVFLDCICWLWTFDKDKARLFYLTLVINGIPAITYTLLANEMTPMFVDINGRRLIVIRYMQWLFTTPAMLYLYSILSSLQSNEVLIAMANGVIMIITGFLGNFLPAPFDSINVGLSFLTFYYVMKTLDRSISLAISECGNSDDESYKHALKGAHLLTTFSWVGVPAVWTLAYFGLISFAAEELFYELFDFIIKSGISCMIMHSSLKTHAEKKQERMRAELAEERGRTIKALRDSARMKASPVCQILTVFVNSSSKTYSCQCHFVLSLSRVSHQNYATCTCVAATEIGTERRFCRRRRRRTSSRPCRTSCGRRWWASSGSLTASSRGGAGRAVYTGLAGPVPVTLL
jgi:bacteriorhodopsin